MAPAPVDLPILRFGEPYTSLDVTELTDTRSGAVVARLSMANTGLISRDLLKVGEAAAKLRELSTAKLIAIAKQAAELFMTATLPLGNTQQSPDDYVAQLAATSGLPFTLCRANMTKVERALLETERVIAGLTRGLPLEILDTGEGAVGGIPVSYAPTTEALGCVLPSNSPGVNSIWLPSIALRTPVIMKPGREEPWTPLRLIAAFVAAGCPREAFGFYPTSHEGADMILRRCGRGIVFGSDATTSRYADDPGIERHGTGRSKILLGADCIERWPDYLDLLATSVAANGGRSCVNASAIVLPAGHEAAADALADALAKRLATIEARGREDDQAGLASFANPAMADWLEGVIEQGLRTAGAEDITARHRDGPRRVTLDGADFLLPTIVRCADFDHPLSNTELLFPYASVVTVPRDELVRRIGPSLVVTAITEDPVLQRELLAARHVDRLNLGPIPTTTVEWDQPHEGNLFESLYQRRAFQRAGR